MEEETEAQAAKRRELEATCREIGTDIAAEMPPNSGFALFMFTLNDEGKASSISYIASGERTGVLVMMREWLNRMSGPSTVEILSTRIKAALDLVERMRSTQRAWFGGDKSNATFTEAKRLERAVDREVGAILRPPPPPKQGGLFS